MSRGMNTDEPNKEDVADEVVSNGEIEAELEAEAASEAAEAASEAAEAAEAEQVELAQPTAEEIAQQWKDTALRTGAELENYRKRMAREKADAIRYANARLLEDLLPALDNFEMGMQAAAKEEGSMVHLGMSMVQKQLNDFLENQGATVVKADGEFDPTLHEAVSEEVAEGVEPGHIVRVMRRGFMLNDRLLRPATVVVAKADDAFTEEPEQA